MIYEDLLIGFLAGALVTIAVRNFTDGYLERQAFKKQEEYVELVMDKEEVITEQQNQDNQKELTPDKITVTDTKFDNNLTHQGVVDISNKEQKELEIPNPKI